MVDRGVTTKSVCGYLLLFLIIVDDHEPSTMIGKRMGLVDRDDEIQARSVIDGDIWCRWWTTSQ